MKSPDRRLRFVVGTTLLALGGCTRADNPKQVNPGPKERGGQVDPKPDPKPDPEPDPKPDPKPDPDETPTPPDPPPDTKDASGVNDPSFFDPDGDGHPNFAPNPGPKDLEPQPEPQPDPPVPPEPDPKRVNVGPQ